MIESFINKRIEKEILESSLSATQKKALHDLLVFELMNCDKEKYPYHDFYRNTIESIKQEESK